MHKAEDLEGLTPDQYGSLVAKLDDIKSLNARLFYDLISLKQIPTTSAFIYLISNYYLVVHIISYISLQMFNAPTEPIIFAFTTLLNMINSVGTYFR